ncbi:MAG: cation diffusion facilitator family transporter [Verrucomicrobiota bacterium]|nr:cation diffusion facilitator family transporter [Verrucomicrobiota bacterium]
MQNRLQRSLRTTFIGMGVNAVLAGVKITAGVVGHSHALVADGIESVADLFSSFVVWRGVVVAAEPADEDHPYGHGKAEPLAAAFVSVLLLVAAGYIAVQAVREIIVPHQTPAGFTLIVLLAVIVAKELLFRYVRAEGYSLSSSVVESDAWHHRSDAITSVAAAVGIIIALIGGPGYEVADDYAALIASAIIAWNGLGLLRPALDELMDRSPSTSFSKRIEELARSVQRVEGIEKCMIRKVGIAYFIDMHVEVSPEMSVREAHAIAHEIKDVIRRELPIVQDVLVHIEPAGE